MKVAGLARISALGLAAAIALIALGAAAAPSHGTPGRTLQNTIDHVIVVYQENWSFDGLYGRYPGANGLGNAAPTSYAQVDKLSGAPITTLPQPIGDYSGKPDPHIPAGLPVAPYDLTKYIEPGMKTGDLVHRFYQQQSQINGGKMNRFALISSTYLSIKPLHQRQRPRFCQSPRRSPWRKVWA